MTAAPWLIDVSRHKRAVFAGAGLLLVFNYWLAVLRPGRMRCAPGEMCHVDSPAMRMNRVLFWSSVAVYLGAAALNVAALWWLGRQT